MKHFWMVPLLAACTATTTPPAASPTSQSFCEAQADTYADTLSKIAAKQGVDATALTDQFVTACVTRVDADVAEIAKDLAGILDAGATQTQGDAQ